MSIKTIGGLKKWLDNTSTQHNGYKYKDFVKNYRDGNGVDTTNLAAIFLVSRTTMDKWIIIYHAEKGTARPKKYFHGQSSLQK